MQERPALSGGSRRYPVGRMVIMPLPLRVDFAHRALREGGGGYWAIQATCGCRLGGAASVRWDGGVSAVSC